MRQGALRGERLARASSAGRLRRALACLGGVAGLGWCLGLGTPAARAEIQFDAFVGFDGLIREVNWFPVVFEVFNDGPGFDALIELSNAQFDAGTVRRMRIELPAQTRKRVALPVFASGLNSIWWQARLRDASGKVRAENASMRPKRILSAQSLVMGAMPRAYSSMPSLPDTKLNRPEMQPAVGMLRPELFPDHPIALEGMNALYLNSARAIELRTPQYESLLHWLHAGGHLILAVEQLSDIQGTPWLDRLMPGRFESVRNVDLDGELHRWLAGSAHSRDRGRAGRGSEAAGADHPAVRLAPDPAFEQASLLVAAGQWREGRVDLEAGRTPLIIEASRGRGRLTLLTFSPEREPFRSWNHRAWFWARLLEMPAAWFAEQERKTWYGFTSIDNAVGALVDSRQVRKLPVGWLLLLLGIYLAVIGPVDYLVLKRWNRQTLTWLTFPAYVVLFSAAIWLIGYRLRAGDTEWNELHLVDVLPLGDRFEWRGRTYASLYSPANARYRLAAHEAFAACRGESWGSYAAGSSIGRSRIEQQGMSYQAEVFVPVWTSQLLVHDWWQPGEPPVRLSVQSQGAGWQIALENRTDRALGNLFLAWADRCQNVGRLEPRQKRAVSIDPASGDPLETILGVHRPQLEQAVLERRRAFGGSSIVQVWNNAVGNAMAACFASVTDPEESQGQQARFAAPAGMDLKPLLERDMVVVLAWDAGHAPIEPLRQFQPRRGQRDTLWRLAAPLALDAKSGPQP